MRCILVILFLVVIGAFAQEKAMSTAIESPETSRPRAAGLHRVAGGGAEEAWKPNWSPSTAKRSASARVAG